MDPQDLIAVTPHYRSIRLPLLNAWRPPMMLLMIVACHKPSGPAGAAVPGVAGLTYNSNVVPAVRGARRPRMLRDPS